VDGSFMPRLDASQLYRILGVYLPNGGQILGEESKSQAHAQRDCLHKFSSQARNKREGNTVGTLRMWGWGSKLKKHGASTSVIKNELESATLLIPSGTYIGGTSYSVQGDVFDFNGFYQDNLPA
jgi:hypothetical protein